MADRGIKLRRSEIKNCNHLSIHGFRLRIEVVDTRGDVPAEVFVYMQHPIDTHTGTTPPPTWMTVASFVDLSDYPANAPNPDNDLPFFRLSYVEVDLRSISFYGDTWILVQQQVHSLINAMNKAEQLVAVEDVWIGEPAAESSPSSSSESSPG